MLCIPCKSGSDLTSKVPMPRAPDHWEAPKSTNNVASTIFNTAHLLPKDLRFEPNLFLALGAFSCRYAPVGGSDFNNV